jgi:uncharacterized protein (DUF2384 family)
MTSVAQVSLTDEVARICHLGNLTATHVADATGADVSSARRWIHGIRTPAGGHATRILQLAALVDRLAQVMDPAYIPVWLIKPVARLDDRRPVDVIRDGNYPSLSQLVASLEGMPVT